LTPQVRGWQCAAGAVGYKKRDRKNWLQHHKGLEALALCGGKPQAVPVRWRVGLYFITGKGNFCFYRFLFHLKKKLLQRMELQHVLP